MKTVITALSLAFSLATASAAAVASEQNSEPKVIARLAVDLNKHGQAFVAPTWGIVKVLENKSVTIEQWRYAADRSINSPVLKGTTTINLSTQLANSLFSQVINLSNAKTKVVKTDFVCMMMPPFGPNPALFIAAGYDHESSKFAGELREVQSNTGCWDPEKTYLVTEWEAEMAARLEGALEALAFQSTK